MDTFGHLMVNCLIIVWCCVAVAGIVKLVGILGAC